GAAGAAVFWGVGEQIHSQLLQALGYFGFLINLFNLIPIGFLDGGQIIRAFELLRRGGAKGRAAAVGFTYGGLALLLVLGMTGSPRQASPSSPGVGPGSWRRRTAAARRRAGCRSASTSSCRPSSRRTPISTCR